MHTSTQIAMKRKAVNEATVRGAQSPIAKKVKTTEEAPVVTHGLHIFDATDNTSDDYQPRKAGHNENNEVAESADEMLRSPHLARQRLHRKAPAAFIDAKQRLLDEQVSLIILTRDNNKPDPYGQNSSTYGPLPWPAVAQVYNDTFRIGKSAVGSAAMEKRARQHRDAWMAARPEYPRKIVYAEKVKIPRPKAPRKTKPEQFDQANETVRQHKDDAKSKVETIDFNTTSMTELSSLRVGGWVPPDDVRNRANLNNYMYHPVPVSEAEQSKCMVIDVEGTDEKPLGVVHVPMKEICRSSKWVAREMQHSIDIRLKLICPSKSAVDRYVQCISPVQLTEMPHWDIASLTEVYAIAAQMEDNHVRNLCLKRWHDLSQQDLELELDPEDLNNIFHSTEPDDPARDFWAKAVYAGGIAEQIVGVGDCHMTLVAMLEEMMVGGECANPCGS